MSVENRIGMIKLVFASTMSSRDLGQLFTGRTSLTGVPAENMLIVVSNAYCEFSQQTTISEMSICDDANHSKEWRSQVWILFKIIDLP